MAGRLLIFSGNANFPLAQDIARCLNIPLGRALVGAYKNSETRVKLEDNVRGCDVFVIQPTCTPVNHHLIELLMIIDALRRASVSRVTAVIPYYGYAKQEKKTTGREPIAAKLVANLIRMAGADRVLTMDLHAPAIEGFFDIPVDHLQAGPILADAIHGLALRDVVIVSPDSGGVARANTFRERLRGTGLAMIARQRTGPDTSHINVLEMVGEVEGKTAVIVDDMISTGRTLMDAVSILQERGAQEVYACVTHGVFAGDVLQTIAESPIARIIVTNTIPQAEDGRHARVQIVSVAPLFAEAIMRIHKDLSLSVLFS
jgi:ribose-phosphate pyrophosphokinase